MSSVSRLWLPGEVPHRDAATARRVTTVLLCLRRRLFRVTGLRVFWVGPRLRARSAPDVPAAPTTCAWRLRGRPGRSARLRRAGEAVVPDRSAGLVRQGRADAAGREGPRHVGDPEEPHKDR